MTYEPPPAQPVAYEVRPWYERIGYGLILGGGASDFVGTTARDQTSLGGAWNVRLTMGTRSWIAGELAYIGSAQSINNTLGLSNNAVLIGNGAEGLLRVNFGRMYYFQPFIFGGAAWRHYDITNSSFNTSDIRDHADELEVPAGLGFAGYLGHGFMLDVRGEYRFNPAGDDLFAGGRGSNTAAGQLDRWDATGNIGVEF